MGEKVALRVVTHSETFHADEVCGVALLCLLFNDRELRVIRTRDQSLIDKIKDEQPTTIVIDVGQIYNPEELFFDHHQKSFSEKYDPIYNFPMSSSGLIWKKFGGDILEKYKANNIRKVKDIAYKFFFAGIDANDNGVSYLIDPNSKTNYKQSLSLSFCISQLNTKGDSDEQDNAFLKAVGVAKVIIDGYLNTLVTDKNHAKS